MTSFALAIEPAPQPRLAAAVLLWHGAAAASPWLAHCPPTLAAALCGLALAATWATLARVPGAQGRLRALAWRAGCWRVRLADGAWQPATLERASRAYGELVLLELQVGGRRHGWLLPRRALPAPAFRRLKALVRLAW